MDVLGIGANMVKALRYWMVAVGLTVEARENNHTIQRLTPLGEVIRDNDPYFEEAGTLFLLHYGLVKEKNAEVTEATAWWYFFNDFKISEFTRDDFLNAMDKYLRSFDDEKPVRTIEDDFNCIINTYVSRMKANPKKVKPESNIDCPLGELGLIDIVGTERNGSRQKIYRKSAPKKDLLHPLILLAVILDNTNGEDEIRISSIQNDYGNAGRAFNLDIINLTALLYKIEIMGLIKVNRTAGLDVINIKTGWSFLDCIEEYYRAINE
jgi:hypothetical protein